MNINTLLISSHIQPKKWLDNTFVNGTKICDENSIYSSKISPQKAIRIMQEELESETVQIGARIDWSKSIRTRYFA